ncbi:IclR family transcriptional regulator [Bacillus sp. FJAT-27264]|uniref:IclR family transcriptional regulator n=1 Tax=Paenibacillus sp. (strain DSM 101736 / FJAT-27264) TaxID=1850362 RepID=UPI000A4AAB41
MEFYSSGGGDINRNEVGTLKKGLDIFNLVLHNPNITTQEIMEELQLNQSTAYRLVSTLEQNDFIMRSPKNGFVISDVFVSKLESENLLKQDVDLLQSVPSMDKLSKTTGETSYIGMLHGTEVVITHAISGMYATRTHHVIGDRKPIRGDAIGKCLLAYQSEELQSWILENMSLEKQTEHTITSQEKFREELSNIKVKGYALDDEEGECGARCIGAPIWKDGKVIAAIAISGPTTRVSKEKDDYHIEQVTSCAQEISNLLSHESIS